MVTKALGEIALPAGDIGEPFVDADDIADVAVAALTEDGHAGQVYELTGPRLLTFAEAANAIARATGRAIRHVQIPPGTLAAGVTEAGLPKDIAWLLNYLFATVLDGRNARLSDGVRRALGREPCDFAEYARRVGRHGRVERIVMTSNGGGGMDQLIPVVATMALLGSALVGGIFFAFSSFVMKALARVPSAEGIAAMQSINVVVLNPSFLGAFIGTAVLSLVAGGLALADWDRPSGSFFLAGAIFYLVGTFLVTVLGNVPLNDQLAAVSATDPGARDLWERYLGRWTMWNHVRTVAAMAAALLYSLGLMQNGSA